MKFFPSIGVLCLISFVALSEAANKTRDFNSPSVDDNTYERYKTQVCGAVPAFQGKSPKSYTFLDEISEEEVYELAFMNMAYGLPSDSISHLTEDMGYKKRVLDIISFITKRTCASEVVPESYLNVAKNLFLYYMYKRSKSPATFVIPTPPPIPGVNTTDKTYKEQTWTEILGMLEQCSQDVETLPISTVCDAASFISLGGEDLPLGITEEQIDIEVKSGGHEFMDEIIEAVWFMFSTTYARCYTLFYPREDWVVQFFDNFNHEFLAPLVNRWRRPGPMAEFFPLIFGPGDFRMARANLRACNTGAYLFEGIAERQLVRPLTVTVDGINMYNFKAGVSLTK